MLTAGLGWLGCCALGLLGCSVGLLGCRAVGCCFCRAALGFCLCRAAGCWAVGLAVGLLGCLTVWSLLEVLSCWALGLLAFALLSEPVDLFPGLIWFRLSETETDASTRQHGVLFFGFLALRRSHHSQTPSPAGKASDLCFFCQPVLAEFKTGYAFLNKSPRQSNTRRF